MLKKTIAIFIAASALASAQQVQTQLDGRTLQFDQPAIMQDGRVMVPLRGIFESLGADVLFDSSTRTIKATKGDRVVELTLGSREARINGQMSYLDVPASTMGGRTLVPLRFVSESLGAEVKWMPSSRTVALTSNSDVPNDLSNLPNSNQQHQQQQQQQQNMSAPTLTNVVHNARRTLGPGDRLVVTANGDSGGQATFDLLGITNGVYMREVAPGRYEGELTISNGMQVNDGTLVVRLRRNNQEAVLEGRRAVSINSTSTVVNNNNNYPNNPNQPPLINLTNMTSGANVPGVFNLQGQTTPYSQVQVTAQAQRSLIPGVIGVQSQVAAVTRQADAFGHFDIQVDVSSVPVNTPISLQISASDQQGRISPATRLDVTRR